MKALSIRGLRKGFVRHLLGGTRLEVLRGVDLDVPTGGCVVVRGPSGSGKSSLLRCAYRTYRPDAGTVVLHAGGDPIDLASAGDRSVLHARRRIGLATQFLAVTPRVSARDLVVEHGAAEDEAVELLRSLGLAAELLDAPPATFSGGERQIVNLALALAARRPVLLLDEVTASLDPARRRLALRALRSRKEEGATLLAVFHDLPALPGLVDRVVEMRDGRVVST